MDNELVQYTIATLYRQEQLIFGQAPCLRVIKIVIYAYCCCFITWTVRKLFYRSFSHLFIHSTLSKSLLSRRPLGDHSSTPSFDLLKGLLIYSLDSSSLIESLTQHCSKACSSTNSVNVSRWFNLLIHLILLKGSLVYALNFAQVHTHLLIGLCSWITDLIHSFTL